MLWNIFNYLPVSVHLCRLLIQFQTARTQVKCQAWSASKLIDTLMLKKKINMQNYTACSVIDNLIYNTDTPKNLKMYTVLKAEWLESLSS